MFLLTAFCCHRDRDLRPTPVHARGRDASLGVVRSGSLAVRPQRTDRPKTVRLADPPVEEGDRDRVAVETIERTAQRIQGTCQKYPKIGKNMFSSVQDRFFAAIPAEDSTSPEDEAFWRKKLHAWRRGRLEYWTDHGAHKKGEKPKGFVDLLNITTVSWEEARPQEVRVSHKEDGEEFDMVLRFASHAAARDWGDALNQLRRQLQRSAMGF